jgi:hypothetical protein
MLIAAVGPSTPDERLVGRSNTPERSVWYGLTYRLDRLYEAEAPDDEVAAVERDAATAWNRAVTAAREGIAAAVADVETRAQNRAQDGCPMGPTVAQMLRAPGGAPPARRKANRNNRTRPVALASRGLPVAVNITITPQAAEALAHDLGGLAAELYFAGKLPLGGVQ